VPFFLATFLAAFFLATFFFGIAHLRPRVRGELDHVLKTTLRRTRRLTKNKLPLTVLVISSSNRSCPCFRRGQAIMEKNPVLIYLYAISKILQQLIDRFGSFFTKNSRARLAGIARMHASTA
jgi:hypothetical protein